MSAYNEDRESLVSYEIIYRILNHMESKGRSLKTRILYASNLNSKSLEKYLDFLLEKNLISEVCISGKKFYVLTARGREFLYKLRKIREDISNHRSKRLSDLVKNMYLEKRVTVNTYELNNKRLHVVIVDSDSTTKETLSELMLSYVNARIDGDEVLGVIPSRLYDKVIEILNDLGRVASLRLYTYNEREDLGDLTLRIVSLLRSLDTQYRIII
ncbi:MAG: winged helix-turn-helix domain-containing protein [Zestosphaera sp.]